MNTIPEKAFAEPPVYNNDNFGDLILKFNINFPKELSEQQLSLINNIL